MDEFKSRLDLAEGKLMKWERNLKRFSKIHRDRKKKEKL